MHPTTIIELALISGAALVISFFALLLPKKGRKIGWSISCLILFSGIIFYAIRPFIVQHQTSEAIMKLEKHFNEIYPEESWLITDTDEYKVQSSVTLLVRFESEPKIVYKYIVEDTTIEQVDLWLLSGDPVEGSGIDPHHYETN